MDILTAARKTHDKFPSAVLHHDAESNIATVTSYSSARVKLLFGQTCNVLIVDENTCILLLDLL